MPTGQFIRTEEHRRNISKALKGKPKFWNRKEKIKVSCPCGNLVLFTPGQIRKGHGKYCSRECTFKYRDNSKFLSLLTRRGKDNQNWKGDKAGYKALHLRVGQIRGKAFYCENDKTHKSNKFEWANLTGKYEDVNDYKSLCHKCHMIFDDVISRAVKTRKSYGRETALKGWITRRGGDATA